MFDYGSMSDEEKVKHLEAYAISLHKMGNELMVWRNFWVRMMCPN